ASRHSCTVAIETFLRAAMAWSLAIRWMADNKRERGMCAVPFDTSYQRVRRCAMLPPMRTLIENGTLVTASDSFEADLLIESERIAAIGRGQTFEKIDRRIAARGKYVIPGGIDVHTHMDMPFGGTTSADDFESGTRAAAFGGTTTIVDFAI